MTPKDISAHIPAYVHTVIDVLQKAGKKAYPVGGCVRDLLRGVTPHDFDLTTSATPDEMLEILKDFRIIPTGAAHGTLTVLSDGVPLEITTHRTDGDYADGRHPDAVSFTRDLLEDLKRRDFTVNAMAWDKKEGVIDPFDGQNDLKRGVIRAVGDAPTRFREDALRILRCFRFSSKLNFTVEEDTLKGAAATKEGLSQISAERIFAELTRTLTAPYPELGLLAMEQTGCTKYVFLDTVPDLSLAKRLQDLPEDAPLRLAALLHSCSFEAAESLCRRLRASNAFTDATLSYLSAASEPLPTTPYEARRYVCTHFPYFEKGLLLFGLLHNADTKNPLALCRKVLRDGTAVELRRLTVSGKELQTELGVLPAMTGKMLLRLQDAVWQQPDLNQKKALLAYAREICGKEGAFCQKEMPE